jgi:hypothetical protein
LEQAVENCLKGKGEPGQAKVHERPTKVRVGGKKAGRNGIMAGGKYG